MKKQTLYLFTSARFRVKSPERMSKQFGRRLSSAKKEQAPESFLFPSLFPAKQRNAEIDVTSRVEIRSKFAYGEKFIERFNVIRGPLLT